MTFISGLASPFSQSPSPVSDNEWIDRSRKRSIEMGTDFIVGPNVSEDASKEPPFTPEITMKIFEEWKENPTNVEKKEQVFRILEHIFLHVPRQKRKRSDEISSLEDECIYKALTTLNYLDDKIIKLKKQPRKRAELEDVIQDADDITCGAVGAEDLLSKMLAQPTSSEDDLSGTADCDIGFEGKEEGYFARTSPSPADPMLDSDMDEDGRGNLDPQTLLQTLKSHIANSSQQDRTCRPTPQIDQLMGLLSIQGGPEEMDILPHTDHILLARQIIDRVYTPFGIHSQPIETKEEALTLILETKRKVDIINGGLPEDLSSLFPTEDIVRDVELLEKLFQSANDISLIRAFGSLAGADPKSPYNEQLLCIRTWLATAGPEECKELSLAKKKLLLIPREIGRLISLKNLFVGFNQLTWIPPEIGNLQALEWLWLGSNQINELPPEIGNLQNLLVLGLGHNKISTITPEIGMLRSLLFLIADFNRLTSLPPTIGELHELLVLILGSNQITYLPREIETLIKLQKLYLDYNHLLYLPAGFEKLTTLRELLLQANSLDELPHRFENFSQIQELDLRFNTRSYQDTEFERLRSLKTLNGLIIR